MINPFRFSIDMKNQSTLNTNIKVVKGDSNSTQFNINIYQGINRFNLTNCIVKIYFKKIDNTINFQTATIIDATNGSVSLLLNTQTINVSGIVNAELVIYGISNDKLTSGIFTFEVREPVHNEAAIQSTNEFSALTEALSLVNSLSGVAVIDDENPSISKVYSSNKINILLNTKADVLSIPTTTSDLTKDDVYTKLEIDTLIDSIPNGGTGDGDMLKSIYDTTNNGIVDRAEIADNVAWSNVSGKPTIPTVSTAGATGSYNDLINKPTIPSTLSQLTDDLTHRLVTDTEKTNWNNKASTSVATALVNGLMNSTDKTKLDGIEVGANNYTHPATHSASIIVEDSTHRFTTDAEKSTWNSKASTSTATTSVSGLMSATDKTKLDSISSDADKVESSATNGNIKINSVETTVYTHPANHSPNIITQDSSNRFVSDVEKATWNAKSTFSGNYADLTNKPTIPISLSGLSDDSTHRLTTDTEKITWNGKQDVLSGDVTGHYHSTDRVWSNITGKPTIPTDTNQLIKTDVYTKTEINSLISASGGGDMMKTTYDVDNDGVVDVAESANSVEWTNVQNKPSFSTVATSGSYTDLSNKPTIPTALSSLTDDSTHRLVTDAEKSTWNNKSNFSGSYNDLTNKPTIPDITPLTNAVNKILTVSAVVNTYTLDLSTSLNFVIETADTNAKTIAFSNIPATSDTVTTISIILKFTNSASFTYPSGTVWKDGTAPSYTAGKKYMLMLTTYDNGTSYLGSYVGAWS